MQSVTSKKPRTGLAGKLTLAAVLIAASLLFVQRQAVADWLKLLNYQPPAAISALAHDDTMTATARHDFYVNHPAIKDRQSFNQFCSVKAEQTVVLGCYHGNQSGIYVLHVTDTRLNGIEQVTAAHEMLHAAYERLSGAERQRIDTLLQNYYDHDLTDTRIRQTIDAYRQSEPDALPDEMHSIFGTEVSALPPALETYYGQYFTNRQQVVTYANDYADEFTSRQQQVEAYDQQLKQLKLTIDGLQASLKQQAAQLQTERSRLDGYRASNDAAAYNSAVTAYNQQVARYNSDLGSLKADINSYNDTVKQRNQLALEEQELSQAISGTTVPQPAN